MNAMLKASGCTYVSSDEPSIADFQLYSQLYDINMKGVTAENAFKDLPELLKWYNTVGGLKGINENHDNSAEVTGIKGFVS